MELPEGFKRVECPEPVEGLSFVYILYCRNQTFYVGQSHNIQNRIVLHREGRGARHTLQQQEFELVYVEGPVDRETATKRERQLKKWSRAKKMALITGDYAELKRLSISRD